MIAPVLISASLLSSILSPLAHNPMRCDWTERLQCGPGAGCHPITNDVWAMVDPGRGEVKRCDHSGCDTYVGRFSRSGEYTNGEVPGRSMLFQIGPAGRATHVVTLGNTVIVYQGRCRSSRTR